MKYIKYCFMFFSILNFIYWIFLCLNINDYFIHIFFILSILFFLLSIRQKFSNRKLYKPFFSFIQISTIIFLSFFVIVEFCILSATFLPLNTSFDTILVLGSKLHNNQMTEPLQNRLDSALKLHQKYPNAKIILSGGIIAPNTISEATIMYDYLLANNIPANQMIKEEAATSTYENLKYTKQLLISSNQNNRICIITSPFHIFRSKYFAQQFNLETTSYPAYENLLFLPYHHIRECFAILKAFLFSK